MYYYILESTNVLNLELGHKKADANCLTDAANIRAEIVHFLQKNSGKKLTLNFNSVSYLQMYGTEFQNILFNVQIKQYIIEDKLKLKGLSDIDHKIVHSIVPAAVPQ